MENVNAAVRELAIRQLEKRYKWERTNLISFIKTYFKEEKNINFVDSPFHHLIADRLTKVLNGDITRLIINIPPWHGKTELVTKCFPVWALGKEPTTKIIATGYSANLTQDFSQEAKDYYKSASFSKIFPRKSEIRKDQDTKENWKLEKEGYYYATWTWWAITGKRANIFIIDDPIKPDEVESEVKRLWVNNWFDNTVTSRLANPISDSIIIIMQRTHKNDLCGHLIDRMEDWVGTDWEVLSLPSIAEENETFEMGQGLFTRTEWEVLDPVRFNHEALKVLKLWLWNVNFTCQYQQQPIAKDSQEFHEEWFRYYHEIPADWRIFTTIDPAFSKSEAADRSVITTVKFVDDKIYILEQTAWKYNPAELEDKIIYHAKKWDPEKIWVEAIQAQTTIAFSLRARLPNEGLFMQIEEIRQRNDKFAKIRSLISLYRNWKIYHNQHLQDLEKELVEFPRGKHDDCPDCLQMCLYMQDLTPNTHSFFNKPNIQYDMNWMPKII